MKSTVFFKSSSKKCDNSPLLSTVGTTGVYLYGRPFLFYMVQHFVQHFGANDVFSIGLMLSDSLLVQGSRKLNSTMLSWHYRSRYETLISYSNHAFYDVSLLTIPDKTIHHNSKPLIEVLQPEEVL